MKDNFMKQRSTLIKVLFTLLVIVGCSFSTIAQVPIAPQKATFVKKSPSATEVLNALNGGGLTLSNPKLGAGDKRQMLIFKDGLKAGLGMDGGVLFATGDAEGHLSNQNSKDRYDSTYGKGEYEDKDLMGIYAGAKVDVVVYEFDVTMDSHTTALRVAFQFGSEEYPTYVGTRFNDAFGFFVTGPNITGTVNMAKLPTNGNAISINTVNGGRYGTATNGSAVSGTDLKQTSQYINNGHDNIPEWNGLQGNANNNGPKPVFIEYNGLTKLITYDLVNLKAGGKYTFKIAIADSGDSAYDSGVIIQKIQGTTGADVKVQKEINKTEVKIGEEVEFTLTATNLGPYDGKGVKVTDKLPSGYTFINATPSTGKFDEKTGVWTIGNLQAVHQTATLKVKALVNAFGDYTNKATITSTDPDPDPDNNTSEVTPKVNRGFQCFNDIVGNGFSWVYNGAGNIKPPSDPVVQHIDQPASDGGFVLDIYKLDNSFNMSINGGQLFKDEIEFQTNDANRNIRFKDSKKPYGSDYADAVWDVNKDIAIDTKDRLNNPTPVIRVLINQDGVATIYGKRNTDALLEELEVYEKTGKNKDSDVNVAKAKTLSLNKVDWIKTGVGADINKIEVKQNVIGQTFMAGFGYGQQFKECETCTVEKDGALKAVNPNNVKAGEVITYTFNVKNLGDMDIYDVQIEDPLFGFDITLDKITHLPIPANVKLTGDKNGNGVLDRNETWTFAVDYKVTSNDIYKTKGVYNRATVKGLGRSNADTMPIVEDSKDPTPYNAGDIGWDPIRPFHTYVPLKGQGVFISNPHIYQKVK